MRSYECWHHQTCDLPNAGIISKHTTSRMLTSSNMRLNECWHHQAHDLTNAGIIIKQITDSQQHHQAHDPTNTGIIIEHTRLHECWHHQTCDLTNAGIISEHATPRSHFDLLPPRVRKPLPVSSSGYAAVLRAAVLALDSRHSRGLLLLLPGEGLGEVVMAMANRLDKPARALSRNNSH